MNDVINNGGPAWPTTEMVRDPAVYPVHRYDEVRHQGMSLRDWFAGQSIPAAERSVQQTIGMFDGIAIAEKAYWLADAMLAQREKAK